MITVSLWSSVAPPQVPQETGPPKGKGDLVQTGPPGGLRTLEGGGPEEGGQEGGDPEEGDSFFDDPLPRPQKTYGW